MARLVIVSNRVGLPTQKAAQAGGLAVALRAALMERGGLWFGWSGRVADPGTTNSQRPEFLEKGSVRYALIDLSRQDYEDYYIAFANATLWPLFHYRLDMVDYRRSAFAGYLRVNRLFAQCLQPLLQTDDMIWVQDYHLIPLAIELRRLGMLNRIGFFLHTPFPPAGLMSALPGHEALMQAFMAYDLVGFQTDWDLHNFREYLIRTAPATVGSDGSIGAYGLVTRADTFPVSIEPDDWSGMAARANRMADTKRLLENLGDRTLTIGVERLDYSKGLPQRIEGYRMLLERWPEHRRNVVFLQIAVPSRSEVSLYRALRREIEGLCGRINGDFGEFDWDPIRYISRSYPQRTLAGFYRHARVGLVTPLRDGMNLVAKEFVAAQCEDDPAVLVLSSLAGAARELDAALLVNPFDRDAIAEALNEALTMSVEERRERWAVMITVLRRNTLSHWRDSFTRALGARPAASEPLALERLGALNTVSAQIESRTRQSAAAACVSRFGAETVDGVD